MRDSGSGVSQAVSDSQAAAAEAAFQTEMRFLREVHEQKSAADAAHTRRKVDELVRAYTHTLHCTALHINCTALYVRLCVSVCVCVFAVP